MENLRKVTSQTAWQLVGKVVTSVSTIIILAIVSRHFGKSGTGIFTLALTYLAFFYLAADFGLNAYVMPELLGENLEKEWRKLLGFRIIWSGFLIFLALIILPFLPFHSEMFNLSVLFGSLTILGNGLFVSSNAVFQSKLRYDLSIVASTIDAIPTVLLIAFFVYLNFSVQSLLIVHMLGWILTGSLSLILVRKFIGVLSPIFDFQYMKKIFKNAWPISLTLVLNVVYFRLDSFILTSLKSFSEVGIYNLAYQVFQSALVLPTFIMNGYYPLMIKKIADDKGIFLKDLKKMILSLLGISILGTLLTLVLSPIVVSILSGGKGFEGSVLALRILSLSFPAFFASSVLMWTLVTLKKYKKMLAIYGLGLLINGFLNFVFIPKYSYIASSYITGVSEYLILILQIIILVPEFL